MAMFQILLPCLLIIIEHGSSIEADQALSGDVKEVPLHFNLSKFVFRAVARTLIGEGGVYIHIFVLCPTNN